MADPSPAYPLSPDAAPTLAVLELASIARAAVVLDAIVKRAPVALHTARRVSPGKFLIVVQGGVAEVEEGFGAGRDAAEGVLVDELILPQAHRGIHDALVNHYAEVEVESLGLFETYTAATGLRCLDAALKATEASLVRLDVCAGIGGKTSWAISASLYDVQAALEAANTALFHKEALVSSDIIARPHPEAIAAYLP